MSDWNCMENVVHLHQPKNKNPRNWLMASVDQGHSMSPMRLHHPPTTGASIFGTWIAFQRKFQRKLSVSASVALLDASYWANLAICGLSDDCACAEVSSISLFIDSDTTAPSCDVAPLTSRLVESVVSCKMYLHRRKNVVTRERPVHNPWQGRP